MKRLLIIVATLPLCAALSAQTPKGVTLSWHEASDYTMVGKLMPDTPNPYHRVDTVVFKGFTDKENKQVRMTTGLAVSFKTNSTIISVLPEYGYYECPENANGIAAHGFDLYIKKNGEWLWAAAGTHSKEKRHEVLELIRDMDDSEKECLLYLPLYVELYSLKIGVQSDAVIYAGEMPFRHRIGIFGSSYTHGSSTGRAGMTYPAQLARMTGLQFLSLGCSGNSKLQSYFADVLAAADVDALVFDGFSNPSPKEIESRLFPFIEKLRNAHPGKPLIFQRTIYREARNFSLSKDANEAAKMAMSDSLMAIAVEKYPDVYYIRPNATDLFSHDTSIDGVHPDNHGYTLWAESVMGPITEILRKYGID